MGTASSLPLLAVTGSGVILHRVTVHIMDKLAGTLLLTPVPGPARESPDYRVEDSWIRHGMAGLRMGEEVQSSH